MPKSIIIKPIEIKLVFSVYLFHYNVYLWSSKDPDRISAQSSHCLKLFLKFYVMITNLLTIIFSIKVVLSLTVLKLYQWNFIFISQKAEWPKDFCMKNVWYCSIDYMYTERIFFPTFDRSWTTGSMPMPPVAAFWHPQFQSGTGAFRYRTGSNYSTTGLVKALAFFIPVPAGPDAVPSGIKFLLSFPPLPLVDFPLYTVLYSIFNGRLSGQFSGFWNNFQRHNRLSESWNKLPEVGYWKDFYNQ